jgi:ankyrin repeat protein
MLSLLMLLSPLPFLFVAQHDGTTPLHVVSRRGNVPAAQELLKRGAFVNAATSTGDTPLVIACQLQSMDLIVTLVDAGADVNLAVVRFTITLVVRLADSAASPPPSPCSISTKLFVWRLTRGVTPRCGPR